MFLTSCSSCLKPAWMQFGFRGWPYILTSKREKKIQKKRRRIQVLLVMGKEGEILGYTVRWHESIGCHFTFADLADLASVGPNIDVAAKNRIQILALSLRSWTRQTTFHQLGFLFLVLRIGGLLRNRLQLNGFDRQWVESLGWNIVESNVGHADTHTL
jgi:hypothetical protein